MVLIGIRARNSAVPWARCSLDTGYAGPLVDWVQTACPESPEIIHRACRGFELPSRRWVIERTFAWSDKNRPLNKDYEYGIESSETFIFAAMTHRMVRRLN